MSRALGVFLYMLWHKPTGATGYFHWAGCTLIITVLSESIHSSLSLLPPTQSVSGAPFVADVIFANPSSFVHVYCD